MLPGHTFWAEPYSTSRIMLGWRGSEVCLPKGVASEGEVGVASEGEVGVVSRGEVGVGSRGVMGVASRGEVGVISRGAMGVVSRGEVGVISRGVMGVVLRGEVSVAMTMGMMSSGWDWVPLATAAEWRLIKGAWSS